MKEKMLAKVISLIGTKGGVWKSTAVQCISTSKAFSKYRIGILEADSQGTLFTWKQKRGGNIGPLNIDIIKHDKARELKKEIGEYKENYDFLFVDLPGQSETLELTRTALACSDLCILPLRPYDKDLDAFDTQVRPTLNEVLEFKDRKSFKLLATFAHHSSNANNYLRDFDSIKIIDKCTNIHRDRAVYTYFSMEGLTLREYQAQYKPKSEEFEKSAKAIKDIELISEEVLQFII